MVCCRSGLALVLASMAWWPAAALAQPGQLESDVRNRRQGHDQLLRSRQR